MASNRRSGRLDSTRIIWTLRQSPTRSWSGSGLPQQLPAPGMSVEDAAAAAVAMAGREASKGKRLPRELRNLAMPDRDWNVAIPYFNLGAKTRDQESFAQGSGTDGGALPPHGR